jgi:hypothetical protein
LKKIALGFAAAVAQQAVALVASLQSERMIV